MSLLEQLVLAWQCLLQTLRQIVRPGLWVPWLALLAIQIVVVLLIGGFAHPWWSWFMAAFLDLTAGETALHYPGVFRALPLAYARADLIIGATFGALAIGASTALFAARFAGQPTSARAGLALALRRAGTLIAVNLPLTLLVLALSLGVDAVMAARSSSGMTRRLARVVTLIGAIGLQATFLYVNALVVVSGRRVVSALRELPEVATRGRWAALALAAFGLIVLLPFQALTGAAETVVARGRPELVQVLVVAQAFATIVVAFILTGCATLVYQSSLIEEENA